MPALGLETMERRYQCFLSYRPADNRAEGRQWATWLHHVIETYDAPADIVGTRNERGGLIPSRIFPVVRDEEELPADADLSQPIAKAIENSEPLLVLCSPGAVGSRFVSQEIVRFKALGRKDRRWLRSSLASLTPRHTAASPTALSASRRVCVTS
jgi:hypothetical protein